MFTTRKMGKGFDNRSFLPTVLIRLRGGYGGKGFHHFTFEFEGRRIIYCYIRKNACTAFKRLIVDLSSGSPKPRADENPIHYLLTHHRAEYHKDILRADRVVFVHRDPIDRAISLFKNKFIQRSGYYDIFADYERVTGKDPSAATFREFVECYLGNGARDPHTLPQKAHLLPIVYTDAIPLAALHEHMAEVLNGPTAEKYFAHKDNASGSSTTYDDLEAASTPASALREILLQEGYYPSRASFLSDGILEHRLRSIYSQDEAFFRS